MHVVVTVATAWTLTRFLNLSAVLSNTTGWGCISEHGADLRMVCQRESFPENMAGVSDMDNCR